MLCLARPFRRRGRAPTLRLMKPQAPFTPQPEPEAAFRIQGVDHVGIRVSDRTRALRFYAALGFVLNEDLPDHQAAELCNAQGVRLNLIFNAQPSPHNVLLDEARKWPGLTHVAFVVDDLERLGRGLAVQGARPTEGPLRIGRRRIAVFFRDPDGNVLEFNQLTPEETLHAPPP